MAIAQLIKKLKISPKSFIAYGPDSAKIIPDSKKAKQNAKLILVTAVNPTPFGEGKTTVAIALSDSLNKQRVNTVLCLRQPSIGPTLGFKGGAVGNGKSSLVNPNLINYGLNGDFFYISTINNLIASIVDNHIY